ncbi:elongation factor G [Motiliproteus sp. SC1-56]|uniref:elongation factor G n=1 Tax=Motiliproteus sp. SC1-56 TaxID=2799565 RepID=UPI001A8C318B|nr:elongation factor G [Motiliproteus sp. SC1-56]
MTTPENLRNIALLGQAGAGKTTLAEALLHQAGAIHQRGSVEKGSALCDFLPQEQALQHSLDIALCHFSYDDSRVNLLDTPGYPDLFPRALGALAAVEAAVVVVNACNGVEQMTLQAMEAAKARKLCRMLVVNRIDSPDADPEKVLLELQARFGAECLPLNLPAPGGVEVTDCFFAHGEHPCAFSSVAEAHTALVDQVVEVDEELMALYLEQGEELSPDQLHAPFEQALREGHLIPVCFVSALNGAGIELLLRALSQLMPTPAEGNPPLFLKGEGDEAQPVQVVPAPDRHLIAHLFKLQIDPYLGKLGLLRVHQGTLISGRPLLLGEARKPIKVAHLLQLQGKEHREIGRAVAGEICALAKIDELYVDAVLHDSHDEDHYHLKPTPLPPPMSGLAIAPVRHGDEQKLSDALHKLAAEDPSLRVEHRKSLNETVLYGHGELHLKVVLERMRQQFNVEVSTQPPQIAYRETITQPAEGHYRHKKQTGGAGQFGEVHLRVAPGEPGAGLTFSSQVVGGAIPGQFIPAVRKGVEQAMAEGVLGGFPMQDIEVVVLDGKHHPVDSKEVAFVAAGKKAFLEAVHQGHPRILEPVVAASIEVPSQSLGDVTGDLAGRRAIINGTSALADGRTDVAAQVPLAELESYPTQLKSMTGGEGRFNMQFSHYAPVPENIQARLASAYQEAHQAKSV